MVAGPARPQTDWPGNEPYGLSGTVGWRTGSDQDADMTITTVAVVGAIGYFTVFGAGFVFRPALVERFGLQWTRAAGKTEVRCYYGAVSWALAGFLTWLLAHGEGRNALVGVLFLAGAVATARIIGTIVDRAVDDPYTRLAVPAEVAFVFGLAIALGLSG